jgi:hypothetical protein
MQISKRIKSLPIVTLISVGFVAAFFEHIAVAMYLLSAIIFYFYLPVLYSYSRTNVSSHIKAKEFMNLKYYPLEFIFWLLATGFFSFLLAHLLADLAYGLYKPLHAVMYPLMVAYLIMIAYHEWAARKLNNQDEKINYEKQGRLIAFELLFVMILLFMLHH